jgi:indole-3-glycerol phosphate synthase
MTILDEIVASTRADLALRRRARPLEELAAAACAERPSLRAALAAPGLSLIAEFKRASPSAGAIRPDASIADTVRAYERGGAAAVSVLTEQHSFRGSLADLEAAAEACSLPLLRKDFVVDVYQLHEARAAGASGVLLIVAALDQPALRELHDTAVGLGLDPLVEVHDGAELERAAAVSAQLIGVNNRDLRDFSVDPERTFTLLGAMPPGALVVSESGINTPADLRRLAERGVDAALIGERLMRDGDPAAALRELRSGAADAL